MALLAAGCNGGPGGGGGKISDGKLELAVLNDQSGVYADLSGKNSVEAVKMAVADYKAKYGDKAVAKKIDVTSADHQNKPDVANSKAQELYDRQRADIILDVPTSSAALAVANVAKAKKKLFMDIGAGATALEGAQCNKYTFHYGYNTYMLAHGTGKTITQDGVKNWYIVYPDYAFGQDMTKNFTAAIKSAGGTIVKNDPTPFPNDNFATFLLKAPGLNPKPQVLGAMQAGGDLVNLVKQYNEYKLRAKGIGLAVGLMFLTDIHSLGPDALAGTKFSDAWYWNASPDNRSLGRQVPGQDRQTADLRARRELLRRHPVPGGGPARRHRQVRRRGQAARRPEVQRRVRQERQDPRPGPPPAARRVPRPGQAVQRGQGALGLREDPQDRPGGRGVPAARPRLQAVVDVSLLGVDPQTPGLRPKGG